MKFLLKDQTADGSWFGRWGVNYVYGTSGVLRALETVALSAREYWDNQWVQPLIRPLAVAGVEPHASKLKAAPDELIRIFEPKDISIAVAGGETQGAWRMFGGRHTKSVSIDAWR